MARYNDINDYVREARDKRLRDAQIRTYVHSRSSGCSPVHAMKDVSMVHGRKPVVVDTSSTINRSRKVVPRATSVWIPMHRRRDGSVVRAHWRKSVASKKGVWGY